MVCFAIFILSFLKLILGSASQNYGPGVSIIAGIVVFIIDIIEIVSQSKKANQKLIPFVISCFKNGNGKDMKRLAWALFFSISPIFIIIVVLVLCSGAGGAAATGLGGATAGNGAKLKGNGNVPDSEFDRYSSIRHKAGSTANDVKQITEAKYNEIQKAVQRNPGISDEELAHETGVNVDTARAYRAQPELSYQEINHIAGNTGNNMQQVSEAKHDGIQKLVRKNPGLSDEEVAQATGVSVDTARAHRPKLNLSYQELNHLAGNTSNGMQQITEAKHNEIQKISRDNPGISIAELAKKAGVNEATARAHKPD